MYKRCNGSSTSVPIREDFVVVAIFDPLTISPRRSHRHGLRDPSKPGLELTPSSPLHLISHHFPTAFPQVDLVDFIDWRAVECLNQSSAHVIDNAIKQVVFRISNPSLAISRLPFQIWQDRDPSFVGSRVIERTMGFTLRVTLTSSFSSIYPSLRWLNYIRSWSRARKRKVMLVSYSN